VTVKPGTRLRSVVCDTEVIVVKAAAGDVWLHCGGQPMELIERNGPVSARTGSERTVPFDIDPALATGTQLGKRYVAADSELEVLCTRAGAGTLTLGGSPLTIRNSKPLPSSD
jgi:hypothetical protein